MKNTLNISRRCVPALVILCVSLLPAVVFGQQSDQNVQATAGASKLEPTSDEQKVKNIMKDFDGDGQHRALAELEKLKTEEARKVLLDVALGRRASESKLLSARRYVRSLDDKSQARKLLQSADVEVCKVGLEGLKGSQIDQELLNRLQALLQTPDLQVRQWVSLVFSEAPDSAFLREKVEAIIRCLDTVASAPDFNKMTCFGPGDEWWTVGGYTCSRCILSLTRMNGTNIEFLKEVTPTKPGNARDCVLVARAFLGDRSVKKELHRIMVESPVAFIRYRAVMTFTRKSLDSDDIAVLKQVAAEDPHHHWGPEPTRPGEMPKKSQERYYVREYAQLLIGSTNVEIEKK